MCASPWEMSRGLVAVVSWLLELAVSRVQFARPGYVGAIGEPMLPDLLMDDRLVAGAQ